MRNDEELMDKNVNHEKLLALLCAFDEFCSDNNIRYSLHGGTLLGAVREQGIIPWDDDADVAMTRMDFNRLVEALDASESGYYIRGNIKKQFRHVESSGLWIDIFVCDYITEKKVFQRAKQVLLTLLDIMNRDRMSVKFSDLEKYSKGKQLAYKVIFAIGRIIPKSLTVKGYTYISEKCFLGKKQKMFRSNDQYVGRKRIFPAEWMNNYMELPFEDRMLSVLEAHHEVLDQCYGADYMTPIRYQRNDEVHDLVRTGNSVNL